ncbi:MAG: ATP-binding cassette domain-containing protein [Clostridia bacterium]|nr:ATP-binding cassette domain-containing protein [Clostridia bacterium]MBQ9129928.1 ATP-binding cassette domain-containing protein [Clostridia bacterium]
MIKIEHLVKHYGKIKAVNDISFTIEDGEIVGFLGPNGAGKSTAMNILCGYLSSTDGSAEINGIDILENPIEAKKQIGFLPEQPPLYPDMTVNEYLNFIYELKGTDLKKDEHLAEICRVTSIEHVRDRMIRNLSKGYKQRVGIAQALVGNPPVLIFDEPTVGLDPKQIVEVRTLIKQLGQKHTVILSTHILSEVQAVCDRIIIINKGKIVANEKTEEISRAVTNVSKLTVKICGPEKNVLAAIKGISGVSGAECVGRQDADSSTYIVESQPGVDMRKPLFHMAAANSWPIIGMEAQGLNLEDVFITAVDEEEARPAKKDKKNRKGGR